MKKIRVLIADDHRIIHDGLFALINAQPDMEVVGGVQDGEAAIQQVSMLRPDVVVVDISMPGLNGVMITERITREHPECKVVALTAYEERGYIVQMLRAGASGYVLKRDAADELIKAVRVVSRGGMHLHPTTAVDVLKNYHRKAPVTPASIRGCLTDREIEVLRLVVHGYVNKEIAARLDISVKTVEAHKSNAAEKLGLQSRAELVRYGLSQGWLQD
jgi:DNA-binding NarL/FixJ family response regulator